MKSPRRVVFSLVAAGIISGCASAPLVNSDGNQSGTIDQIEDEATEDQAPVATTPENLAPEVYAVEHLLNQAEQAGSQRDFDLAEALAERALRIQRTAARAYLVLAQVQVGLNNKDRASDFAQQGLLYTSEGSSLELRLLRLLKTL